MSAIQQYIEAARRGAAWLASQQHDDGSIGPPEVEADVYHKAPYAFALTGRVIEAHRLLDWIKANDLRPNGMLRHFDPGLALYKTNWICQGAHRLARFDVSRPVMFYVLTRQAPCGGFFQNAKEQTFVEPVCIAWGGMSALYLRHMDAARNAAQCLSQMVSQQPDSSRFYYRMRPDGELITDGPGAAYLDMALPAQPYYCLGIAMLFLARLHLATSDATHLDGAQRLFDLTLSCADDAYSYTTAAKSAVGAAILYTVTGDGRARNAAHELAEYLVREQSPEGWWCKPTADSLVVRLDHTAEFVAFLSEIAANLSGDGGG